MPSLSWWPSAGLAPAHQCFCQSGGPRTAHSTPDAVSQMLNRGKDLFLPCVVQLSAGHLCHKSKLLTDLKALTFRPLSLFSTKASPWQGNIQADCSHQLPQVKHAAFSIYLLEFHESSGSSAHFSSLLRSF